MLFKDLKGLEYFHRIGEGLHVAEGFKVYLSSDTGTNIAEVHSLRQHSVSGEVTVNANEYNSFTISGHFNLRVYRMEFVEELN